MKPAASAICPALFGRLSRFWDDGILLALCKDVILTVPPEVIFNVALILRVVEDVADRTRVPRPSASRGNPFSVEDVGYLLESVALPTKGVNAADCSCFFDHNLEVLFLIPGIS